MCAQCVHRDPYEPSEWFQHIWLLYRLQVSGYPFKANDLTMDEWLDIGTIKDEMEAMRMGAGK